MNSSRYTTLILIMTLLLTGFSIGSATAEKTNTKSLEGKKIAFLITEGFHDGETLFPMAYLKNKGADITIVGISPGKYKAYNSNITVVVERSVTDVTAADFDALVIPGGKSPANLREHDPVVEFTRQFIETDKPVAAVCHGPQVVIATGLAAGRTMTGVEGIKDEITAAGAIYVDREVMIDGNFITSRLPKDLPEFSIAVEKVLSQ